MKVEKVSKDACVIITKREQAKELYKELTKIREELLYYFFHIHFINTVQIISIINMLLTKK